jgi:hypothetical protein
MPRDPAKRLASNQRYQQSDKGQATAQASKDIPWDTKATSGVVGLTVLQPKFLEQFPNVRSHFNSGLDQRGTFKGVWLNKEHTEWALERLLQGEE